MYRQSNERYRIESLVLRIMTVPRSDFIGRAYMSLKTKNKPHSTSADCLYFCAAMPARLTHLATSRRPLAQKTAFRFCCPALLTPHTPPGLLAYVSGARILPVHPHLPSKTVCWSVSVVLPRHTRSALFSSMPLFCSGELITVKTLSFQPSTSIISEITSGCATLIYI